MLLDANWTIAPNWHKVSGVLPDLEIIINPVEVKSILDKDFSKKKQYFNKYFLWSFFRIKNQKILLQVWKSTNHWISVPLPLKLFSIYCMHN